MGLWNRLVSTFGHDSNSNRRSGKRIDRARGGRTASVLAGAAGQAGVENLETRQLLSYTITPSDVDPATGLGTIQFPLAWVQPWLGLQQDVAVQNGQNITDDLNDEQVLGNIANGAPGRLLQGSNIRITSLADQIDPIAYLSLRTQTVNNQPNNYLRVAPFPVERGYSFTFPDQTTGALQVVTQFTMDVAADTGLATGLNPFNTQVQIRYRGTVVRTYTGVQLEAARIVGGPQGTGTYQFFGSQAQPIFDEVQVITTGTTGNVPYRVDNLRTTTAPTTWAQFINDQVMGAFVTLTGPIGASLTAFDLYGTELRSTIQLGIDQANQGTIPLVGGAATGLPDFNIGLGAIRITGSDERTSLIISGMEIENTTTPPTVFFTSEGNFYGVPVGSWAGQMDDIESQRHFGYDRKQDPQRTIEGLPSGIGTFIIGSPFVRDKSSVAAFNPRVDAAAVPVRTGFTRANQGIFVEGSIGSMIVDGLVFGSSHIAGYVNTFNVAQLLGSLSIDGDAGSIYIGGDAGRWSDDEGAQGNEVKTGGQIIVGRTLGELNIGGRNALDVTVIGDINSPTTRPPRNIDSYVENEVLLGIDPATADGVRRSQIVNHNNNGTASIFNADELFGSIGQKLYYGVNGLRNDQILQSEWIGNSGTSVRVRGALSGRDPVDGAEDTNDMYAFSSDGSTPISIEATSNSAVFNMLVRIVDENGRTLASTQYSPTDQINSRLTYKPDKAGVYYICVTDPGGNDPGFVVLPFRYTMLVSGMAPTIVGSFTTGGLNGGANPTNPADLTTGFRNSFNVLSGSVGAIRIGVGIASFGTSIDEMVNYADKPNTAVRDPEDDLYDVRGSSYSIAGSLGAFIAGSDIWDNSANQASAVELFVNGDLGEFITGLNPLAGAIGPNEGDVNFLNLRVGGRLGNVNIRGGIGMDQDYKPGPRDTVVFDPARNADVVVQTGVNGGSGDIGLFRTGFHLISGSLSIRTPDHSTIGGLLFSQDVYTEAGGRTGLYNYGFFTGDRGVYLNTGVGSDIRFIDFPRLSMTSGADVFTPIRAGSSIDVIDDNGTTIRITVENPETVTDTGIVGAIRSIPVDGGQGSAVGQISVNLTGGRRLRIEGITQTVNPNASLAFGRVLITGSDANSSVSFTGTVPIDVYRLEIAGPMNTVSNDTPGGDIVFVDATALNSINIDHGDLGTTEFPAFGPQNWGITLGLGFGGGDGGIGSPITVPKNTFFDSINGSNSIYRPVNDDEIYANNAAYADDLGMPVHDVVRGIIVRTGSLTSVTVSGNMYDVYVPAGSIGNILGNSDGIIAVNPNRFEGISGVIYAGGDIGIVDPGDGIAPNGDSPVANTGIVALDDIGQINLVRLRGAVLTSNILALNDDSAVDVGDPLTGLANVTVVNGVVRDAFFGSDNIDSWWHSSVTRDGITHVGAVGNFTLNNTDFFRSTMSALNIGNITIDNGSFDASRILAGNDIGTITASGYKNSTLLGDANEVRYNEILAGHDLDKLLAGTAGGVGGGIGAPPNPDAATSDISDLTVEVGGSITGGIASRNISRSKFSVAVSLPSFAAGGSIRASILNAGSATLISAGSDIVSSELNISGVAESITAGNRIFNSAIRITGAAGRLNSIHAGSLIDGELTVTGTVQNITSGGDIKLTLNTSSSSGNITLLQAVNDVDVRGDIGGNLQQLIAGRNFGSFSNPGSLVVRGDILGEITATSGVIYNEVRVGGAIRGTILSGGRVSTKPGANLTPTGSIISAGPISAVTFNSDFGGDIISYSGGIANITINNGSLVGGRLIAAYDGSIANITITNGNLLSNIYTDLDIQNLLVGNTADHIFGSVGVDDGRSAVANYDTFRNQLPQGYFATTAIQGVRIEAARDILNVAVTGNFYESGVVAGRRIVNLGIAGNAGADFLTAAPTASYFSAGDSIDGITIGGGVGSSLFVAGITAMGKDNRPGGIGTSTDTIKPGNITAITIGGNIANVNFAAGMFAGADGVYNTFDDKVINGLSSIRGITVNGTVTNSKIYGDIVDLPLILDPRFQIGGIAFVNQNPAIDNGVGTPGVAIGASSTFGNLTFNFTGTGQAFFNAGTNKVVLRNTNGTSQLVISSVTTIPALTIVTNDDASLGVLRYASDVSAAGTVLIDGDLGALQAANFNGSVTVGGTLFAMATANFRAGFISAQAIGDITINGDFGNANKSIVGEVGIQGLSAGVITVTGATRGLISINRDATSFTSGGAVEKSLIRFGGSVGNFTAPSIRETFISAGENIGVIAVTGDVFDTSIMAGLDLGTDGTFGGTGAATDSLSAGSITSVTVGGNFREADLTAGLNRGADSFFGTSDDVVAAGRSSIGPVIITGNQTGSTRNSETYRIAASGPIGAVTVGGLPFTSRGNFSVNSVALPPLAIQVTKIETSTFAQVFTSKLFFNQEMDASSFSGSLSIYEVRGNGDVEIRLMEGVDYTLVYNTFENSVSAVFSRAVTERNMPQLTGTPGPGVFRFKINATLIRAREDRAKLDGNGNGLAALNETFSQDDFVGDAGDKIAGEIANPGNHRVDFYPAANLNIVLDNNYTPDGLPDVNEPFTIRGSIGDHPDNDVNFFRFGGDLDVYRVTLKAGQVLRLGRMQGTARNAIARLFDVTGTLVGRATDSTATEGLPVKLADRDDFETDQTYLIKTTGTYFIAVGASLAMLNGANPGVVNNPLPVSGAIGDYRFDVTVFDDFDTGFTSNVDSSDGNSIQNAPSPIAFAGPDQDFATTADNVTTLVVGNYIFTLNVGTDGIPNTADDVVTGSTIPSAGGSVTSTRDGSGVLTTVVSSAIGEVGHRGLPSSVVTADADIYHLNNRQPILPGTRMKITVKMALDGADFGSRLLDRDNVNADFADYRGQVQFAFFDTSNSVGLSDASLVFSPSDLKSFVGKANTVIAADGTTTYGYDANGDFYIDFLVPSRQGASAGTAGTFAIYLQGAFNSDYKLEVITQPTVENAAPAKTQNFLIETNGGSVNWLEQGGVTTSLLGVRFTDLGILGGLPNGTNVADYILNRTVAALNTLYQSAGFDVHFSTNPADFEFQDFSTVYLTSSVDPLNNVFAAFEQSIFGVPRTFGDNLFNGAASVLNSVQTYGYSQHVDPFNTDSRDEAVVFLPSFSLLGYNSAQASVDLLVQSLTASIGRKAGELMGMKGTATNAAGGTTFDPFADNSVADVPGPGRLYTLINGSRELSNQFDDNIRTDFYLGRANAVTLLDRYMARN